MKTKTNKTPLMISEVSDPKSCSSGFVPKSELLHNPEAQYGLVPKLSHHGGKNIASLKNISLGAKPMLAMRSFFQ